MLFDPTTARIHFWATKFISLVDLEQENTPIEFLPWWSRAARKPAAARAIASSQVAGRSTPFSLTNGSVIRRRDDVLSPRDRELFVFSWSDMLGYSSGMASVVGFWRNPLLAT
jgi:hypothetical protein